MDTAHTLPVLMSAIPAGIYASAGGRVMKHRHIWREIDRCCSFCPKCDAVKYHGEIVEGGRE